MKTSFNFSSICHAVLCLATGCSLSTAHSEDLRDFASTKQNEEILRSICNFYVTTNKSYPAGTLLSGVVKGKREYYAITASHVMENLTKRLHHRTIGIGLASKSDVMKKFLIHAPFDQIPKCSFSLRQKAVCDLALLDMTDGVPYAESQGAHCCSIDIDSGAGGAGVYSGNDSTVVQGAGVALRRDYDKLGIGIGTELFCICADITKDIVMDKTEVSDSLIYFTGRIWKLDVIVTNQYHTSSRVHILKGHAAQNGNSGSAVFAWGTLNGQRHPFLIGAVQGEVPNTDEVAVMPIDGIYELITLYRVKRKEETMTSEK